MLLIGHRGAKGLEPENTLLSFKKALTLGVDMVELDVQQCMTGELVVIHDSTVNRTTNGKGRVADLSIGELRALDAGKDEKIPLLSEVIELIDRKIPINIELKDQLVAEPVAETIRSYIARGWQAKDFMVSSFFHRQVKLFSDILPDIQTGALLEGIPLDYARFAEELGACSAHASVDFVDEDFVKDAHTRNLKIFVYTVNTPEDMEFMKSLGVDGIFTDYPDRFL